MIMSGLSFGADSGREFWNIVRQASTCRGSCNARCVVAQISQELVHDVLFSFGKIRAIITFLGRVSGA